MPKKAKKDDKKKSKVKKIPAKAGAKARVSKDGKVEVVLPVDRSRGPYKKRKTEEQKIQERIEQLRAQERKQYSRDVLAPERISGGYRAGGSIYRSDVQAPVGGFTNLSSVKDQKEDKRLKAVEEKLDKLIEKKEPKKVEPEPAPAPATRKPLIEEVSTRPLATRPLATRRRETTRTTATPLTGQTVRPQPSGGIVSDIGSGVSALASAGLSAGIGLATAGLSGVLTTAQREIEAGRERRIQAEKEREKEKRKKEREAQRSIFSPSLTLRDEPNVQRERRELDRRRKALQDEENRKDREHAFKEREKIVREEQQLRQQEKSQAKKDAEDIFSELELAKKDSFYIQPQPRTNIPVPTQFIPPATEETDEDDLEDPADVEDTDEEFQSAEELEEGPTPPPRKPKAPELPPRDEPEPAPALPPRDKDAEQKRQQILQDQELARELLREEARNKDRKIKEAQERANELEKLNRDFIAHKNREDRNARRREQRRKDKEREELAKRVAGDIINRAKAEEEVEEEVQKIVVGGATAGLIERAPVSVGRGRKINTDKLIEAGATRQDIQDYEQDNADRKRLVDGIYSAFGINLTGTGGGLDYVKSGVSKDKRLQIRRDSIRKLRERGLLVNQIQEFTRTLDRIDELIKRRDDFGNRFQRRGGAVELRAGGGRGRAGRPRRGRGQRVPQQIEDLEKQNPQPRD